MKRILLSQGKFAMVDHEDYEWLSKWKWTYKYVKTLSNGEEYGIAVRGKYDPKRQQNKIIRMHRKIMKLTSSNSKTVDHINGNRLDNRRQNLRIASLLQNNKNKRSIAKSGYKNVYPVPHGKRWYAKIMVDRNRIHLGTFATKIEAARAYNEAAQKYHGEFACLNNI